MADIEKATKGLECCTSDDGIKNKECKSCPYYEGMAKGTCWVQMNRDALELLKELNIKGHWIPIGAVADCNGVRIHSFKCSECGERTDRVDTNRHINFCPMCGTAMKEDETN